ncbi:MAG: hypothetical protein QNL04_13785 [SAR324 cluster bacterium]|nr:hypothetical protein [SAR324 cluster bacterium]
MRTDIKDWKQEHLIWYIELIVHAMDADDDITSAEMEILAKACRLLKSTGERERIVKLLESEKPPVGIPPAELSQQDLAWVFTQVVAVFIADFDFSREEDEFLSHLSWLFNLSDHYFEKLLAWAKEGFKWKQSLLEIFKEEQLPEDFAPEFIVPLHLFNSEQTMWYAEMIVSAIVIDEVITDDELVLFKMVVSFVREKENNQKLLSALRNRQMPKMHPPQGIEEATLKRVLIEIINHFIFNNEQGDSEQAFVKELSEATKLSSETLALSLQWWREGIAWLSHADQLIKEVS